MLERRDTTELDINTEKPPSSSIKIQCQWFTREREGGGKRKKRLSKVTARRQRSSLEARPTKHCSTNLSAVMILTYYFCRGYFFKWRGGECTNSFNFITFLLYEGCFAVSAGKWGERSGCYLDSGRWAAASKRGKRKGRERERRRRDTEALAKF